MDLSNLMPFREAPQQLQAKGILPTNLTTSQIRQLAAAVRRRSFFSAQTMIEDVLEAYKEKVLTIINPVQVPDASRITPENPQGLTTRGLDRAQARLDIKNIYREIGFQPDAGTEGTLRDLSSDARINLVLKTNEELATGAGHFIQGNSPDVVDAFPCQELVRFEQRKMTRDWGTRWLAAAADSGDTDAAKCFEETGRMVARKDSPIWDSLGSSDLFADGLDNPFAPFAYNSGMGTLDVSYDEAKDLGLVDKDTEVEPRTIDFGEIFGLEKAA